MEKYKLEMCRAILRDFFQNLDIVYIIRGGPDEWGQIIPKQFDVFRICAKRVICAYQNNVFVFVYTFNSHTLHLLRLV